MPESIPYAGKIVTEKRVSFFYSSSLEGHLPGDYSSRQPKWCFKITESHDHEAELGYQFDVVDEGDRVRVEAMENNGDPRYTLKGISAACITLVSGIFKKEVVSSARCKMATDAKTGSEIRLESRSDEATWVWKKMQQRGKVTHDPIEDRYHYPSLVESPPDSPVTA